MKNKREFIHALPKDAACGPIAAISGSDICHECRASELAARGKPL